MPRVSVSRLIAAPVEDVWAVLSDVANARRWNEAWSTIEFTSASTHGKGTRFRARTAGDEVYEFEVSEWVAPELIAFTPIREEHERYEVTLERHAFRLRPAGDGTEVELSADASASGLMGRFVALFLWPGHQKHGLNEALDSLQAIFEPLGEAETEPEGAAPTSQE
jgi:uncharacterized protein YndB with AHSA1/START domain